MTSRKPLLVIAGLFAIGLIAAGSVSAQSDQSPPTQIASGPSDEQGILPDDLPKPGDLVPVVGPDGNLIQCQGGDQLMVAVPDAPPATPADAISAGESEVVPDPEGPGKAVEVTDPLVPRCGPDSEAVWVAASEAADRAPDAVFPPQ